MTRIRQRRSGFTLVELPAVSKRQRAAFTLVELLVVIGIIALLISILLPSLQKARRAANTIACASNIRSILQAMHIYASQNNGSVPGSPWTSSRFIYDNPTLAQKAKYNGATISDTNCPSAISTFDWCTPILRIMGVKFNEGATVQARVQASDSRWNLIRNFKGFKCPDNDIIADVYQTPNYTRDINISYNTALAFLFQDAPAGAEGYTTMPKAFFKIPSSYNCKISKAGQGATKIYIADGARYSNVNMLPDAGAQVEGRYGGAFADQGAWSSHTNSWDRGAAKGNASAVKYDARVFAYRHGTRKQYGSSDTYRGNFGFFDGHVDTLGDLASANPAFWLPKGTSISNTAQEMYPDVVKQHCGGATSFTVP